MLRSAIASVAVATVLALTAAPAFAGPAENAFLQKLTASWTGRGHLSGAESGPVACRIVFTGGGQSIKYQGRCSIPDVAAQAFNGAIIYNDQTKRYESRSMGGTAIGVRHGNSLVFTTKTDSAAGRSYSTMSISPTSLVVDFSIIDQSGDKTTSRITFSK